MESNTSTICVRAVYYNRIVFEHFIQGNQITLDYILDKVNLFIASEQILDFLDIQLKTEESWVDIMDLFGSGQQVGFYIQYFNMKPIIQIRLSTYTNDSYEKEKKMRLEWQKKVRQLQQKSESIQKKILLDAKKMEDDDTVDLAFLYAEPLVERNTNNKNYMYKKTSNDRVSFYQETQKILNTLSEKGFTRSLNIEIKPATIKNLNRILNSGVKILHFACHGNQNTLEIQSQKIGISYQLKAQQLIQLLKEYKLPSIIVFNVCKSSNIAKQIHDQFFNKQKKNVATVGYKVYIENKFCEMFAENFYPNIFNSLSITKSFEKALQIIKNDNIQLYNKEGQRIAFQSTKIKEFKKELVINDTIYRDEVISKMVIYKEKIYNFINKFNSQSIINLYGCPKTDKSIFIAKSISYFQERDGVSNCLLLNLRDINHNRYVQNIVEYQCKLQEQIRNKQLQLKSKLSAIVIDHCDCLVQLQGKQFFYHLKRMRRSNECIIILVTTSKIKIQQNQDCDMPIEIRYEKMCEEAHKDSCKMQIQLNSGIKQMEAKEIQNDILSLAEYSKKALAEKLPDFFKNLPLVSIFDEKLYQSQNKNYQSIISSDVLVLGERVSNQIFLQASKFRKLASLEQKQSSLNVQLNRLISKMYIVLGSQLLLKMEKKIRKQEQANILMTLHNLLNTCIIILNEETLVTQTQISKQFKLFKIKMYFILSQLYCLDKEQQVLEVVQDHLRQENDRQINLVNQYFGIDLLQLLKVNMKLQNCSDYPSNNWDLWKDVFEKANQLLNRKHLKVINIDLLLLYLINPIRQKIVEMSNRSLNQVGKKQCKQLIEFLSNYSYLESSQSLFWPLYKMYYPYYIQLQFQLCKVRLQDQKQFGYTCKVRVAEQLETWIQKCKNQDIQNKILNFKQEYFNIFTVFVGFQYKKYYRYSNAIQEMLLTLYSDINKSILLKYELLREDNQSKWSKSLILIPVALFAIDIIVHHKPRDHRSHSTLYVLLQKHNANTRQCFEGVDIKKIKFPDCKVGIFFGQNVSQLKKQQHIYKKFEAAIIFECNSQNQLGKLHLIAEETRQDQVKQIFDNVINGIITRQVLKYFYLSFCIFMFGSEEKYQNREDQIYKSFFNAKLKTRYKCIKNLNLYHEKINKIVDGIQLRLLSNLTEKKPLTIGKNMNYFLKDFNILRSQIKRPSKKKRNQYIYNIDQENEIGYNQQLNQILTWMYKPREKYLILVCHLHEEENFFYHLCRRIRSMGLFKVQWVSSQSARKQSIAIQSIQSSQSSLPVLQILDLSEKQMKQGEMKMQEKIEFEEKGGQVTNKKTIFVFKSFSNLHKQIQKISIRRTSLKTLIGLLSNKILELKNKRSNSRDWEPKFIKELTKQINRRKFEMSAYELKQVNNVESVISSLLKD